MFLPQEIIRQRRRAWSYPTRSASIVQGNDERHRRGQIAFLAMAVYFNDSDHELGRLPDPACATPRPWLIDGILAGHCLSSTNAPDRQCAVTSPLMLWPHGRACSGFDAHDPGRGLGHTGSTLDKLDTIPAG